ncbi:MAG: hypothetical protein GXP37_08340 [Chloroflexi bacterium]|nr:hypothetical protein [Chloroflexota bacterium]
MNARERVLAAINHEEPDRVPIDLGSVGPTGIHVLAYERLLKVLGIEEEIEIWDVVGQLAKPSETVLELVGADVRGIRVGGSAYKPVLLSATELVDHWGTVWRRPEGGLCFHLAEYPLRNATQRDLESYPWPDGKNPDLVTGLAERARYLRENTPYAVLGEFAGHFFERAQMVRGFDTFLLDLAADRDFAEELMDRILAVEIDIVSAFLDAVNPYIDIIAFKDDIAMQSGPVISPQMFREMIKPRMKKLIEAIRRKTQAKLWFHSCGSVYYAIPDLIELGVEILNPVQVRAAGMDTARLKRSFGKNLAFWGGIDTQHVLPFGTPEDVKAEVRQRISDLAPGGGYILASVHNIEADVSGENVWAMYQAAHHYGRYPLRQS